MSTASNDDSTSNPDPTRTDGGAPPAPSGPATHATRQIGRARAFRLVAIAYVVAGVVAWLTALAFPMTHPIATVLWADVAATCVIFAFSVGFSNSSLYDPYWSVVPPVIAAYYIWLPDAADTSGARAFFVFVLVLAWGYRLTHNWARGWKGIDHEDWRYVNIRAMTGPLYWPASFFGIHMLPTFWVFAGCLSLYPALVSGGHAFGVVDVLAIVVTGGAIWLEGRADNELLAFKQSNPPPGSTLNTGLWGRSRHPNYLGEILFWWGLWLFGVAAHPESWWWTLAGPASISLLFRFASLRMIENRMRQRRPDYEERMAGIPVLIPKLGR